MAPKEPIRPVGRRGQLLLTIQHMPGAAPAALRLDLGQRQVWLEEQACTMADRAFDLLVALASRPGQVMTASELLAVVWPDRVVEPNNLRVQVRSLRLALGEGAVLNIRGQGYALAAQDAKPVGMLPPSLPAARAPLLGRDEELQALTQLKLQQALVTVLGPAGIGKTSLVLAAVHQAVDQGQESVVWVDLASLPAPADAPGRVATALAESLAYALGLPRDPIDTLTQLPAALSATGMAHLRGCVVLDNAEHLCQVDDGPLPLLLARLLAQAPQLRWLVTSQQPLRLAGEALFPLGPLAVAQQGEDRLRLRQCPAVQLLARRAAAVDHRFVLRDGDLAAAAAIVRRLDGVPLAIELAGSRLPLLGAPTLLGLLDARLRLLAEPNGRRPDRQNSLRAAIAWSIGLLSDVERRSLLWLSAFVAPLRLDTAQGLLVRALPTPMADHRLLADLQAKSLLHLDTPSRPGPPARVRLLESVRLYAQQELANQGVNVRRKAEWLAAQAMAQAAERALDDFYRQSDADWLAHWWPDHEDVMRAFDTAYAQGDAGLAAPLMEWLVLSANITAQVRPAVERMAAARSLAEGAAPRDRARLLSFTQPHQAGTPFRREGAQLRVRAWQAVGDARGLCVAWAALALVEEGEGNRAAADTALAACRALDDPAWPPRLRRRCTWFALSALALLRGDAAHLAQARSLAGRLLSDLEAVGAAGEALLVRMQAAQHLRLQGHCDEAVAGLREIIAAYRQAGRWLDVAQALGLLCAALLQDAPDAMPDTAAAALPHAPQDAARLAAARAAAAEALELLHPFPVVARHFLEALPWLACCAGDLVTAAHWQAACAALRPRMAAAMDLLNTGLANRTRAALTEALAPDSLSLAREAAQGWSLEELLSRVRAWLNTAAHHH